MDIVTGIYPESNPRGGVPSVRPCLVMNVYQNKKTNEIALNIAYGTKNLKLLTREGKDLIVQNVSDLNAMGLPAATRFNIQDSYRVNLLWGPSNFACWPNRSHPRLGSLLTDYQKELMWLVARQ